MYLEDLLTTTHVWQRNDHLAVETAGTQQGRVQHVRTVGGGDDDYALIALKTVHLDQQLIQGLLTFIVTAAQSGTTVTTYRINFIDKDDTGRMLLGLFEHVAHTGGTDTDEHFHEIGTGDGEKRHLGLTGNGLGQQGFTGTGRTDHQHTTGDLATEFLELARVTQEFHQLRHIILGLFHPGHIIEGDLDLILTQQTGAALAKGHRATATTAALHLAHKEDPHADQQQHREPGNEDLGQQALFLRRLGIHGHTVVEQIRYQARIIRRVGAETLSVAHPAIDCIALNAHALYPSILHIPDKLGILQRLGSGTRLTKIAEHRHQNEGDDDPKQDIFRYIVQGVSSTFNQYQYGWYVTTLDSSGPTDKPHGNGRERHRVCV